MKKTKRITLGVMGTLFVAGCTPEPDIMRNTYRSKEDCVADYSDNQCSPENRGAAGGWGGGTGGRWLGPYYSQGGSSLQPDDPGPGRDPSRPLVRDTIKRGGFGSFGRSFFRGS